MSKVTLINRRQFAAVFGTTSLLPICTVAQEPKPESSIEDLDLLTPEQDQEFGAAIRGDSSSGGPVGIGPSRHSEIREAVKILLDAPRGANILDTANYFANLNQKNGNGESYSREWKERSNPLITSFFALTGTAPAEGDQTHWCAAFLSFCLFLSGKPNKFTALSGGYRSFGSDASSSPIPGDVAVFSKYGDSGKKGFGHVGFFLKTESKGGVDGVSILGGNQVGDTKSTGAVTEAWFPLQGKSLFLHSLRRY